MPCASPSGFRNPTSTLPRASRAASCASGGATFTTSGAPHTSAGSRAIRAPASSKARVGDHRPRPGARLDDRLDAPGEPAHDVRDERHAALAFGALRGDANDHRPETYGNGARSSAASASPVTHTGVCAFPGA